MSSNRPAASSVPRRPAPTVSRATNSRNVVRNPTVTNAAPRRPVATSSRPAPPPASSQPVQSNDTPEQPPQQIDLSNRPQQQRRNVPVPMSGNFYLQRDDIDTFDRDYHRLLLDAQTLENDGNDIKAIVSINYRIYVLLSSFIDKVRKTASIQAQTGPDVSAVNGNGLNQVLVSLRDLSTLELEAEQRLLRAIVARNAAVSGLGDTLIASISEKTLTKEFENALSNLNNFKNDKDDEDESAEEKDPASVNVSNSGGIYSIRSTDDALPISSLIGYQDAATELLSYAKNVEFVKSGQSEGPRNRNPVCIALYGPPGSGKTTIAQAAAKSLDCIYMYVNAENIVSQWAGGTEKNIAKLFRRARIASKQQNNRRVLMLIDEIDGLLKNRATRPNMTGEEYNRITTFLQMLTPPVGTDNSNMICVFTTNLLQNVDSAVINRCRGKIFMGYIVDPAERGKLAQLIFRDYVNADVSVDALNDATFFKCALVPRDYQNILASVKSRILRNFESRNATTSSATVEIRIDLSNQANRIPLSELVDMIRLAEPATPVPAYFEQFQPPIKHICAWLQKNNNPNKIDPTAYEYFRANGQSC